MERAIEDRDGPGELDLRYLNVFRGPDFGRHFDSGVIACEGSIFRCFSDAGVGIDSYLIEDLLDSGDETTL